MPEDDIMLSKTANNETILIGEHCTELICCDCFLPALKQQGIWLAGYSELVQLYQIKRFLPGIDTLLVTVSGQGKVWLHQQWHEQQAGDWTLIPAGQLVHYELADPDSAQPWQLCWVLSYSETTGPAKDYKTGFTDQAQQLKLLLQFLFAEQQQPFPDQSTALCSQQLVLLCQRLEHQQLSAPLQQLRQALLNRLDQAWTVAQMAAMVCLSERQLHRLCLQHWGHSPKHYLQLLRLRQASLLLTTTHLSIKQVALQTGFINPYHFSTAFKAQYQQSPVIYRQQQNPLRSSEQPNARKQQQD